MKKILFIAIGMMFLARTVNAQKYFGPLSDYSATDFYETRFGFTAGLNMSNIVSAPGGSSSGQSFSTGALAGFTAGLNVDIPIAYPLSFEPGVIYSQKGYKAETSSGGFTQHSQFVEIPLLAKFSMGPVINLYAGPQFSYLVNAENSFNPGFNTANQQFYGNDGGSRAFYQGVVGVGVNVNRYVDVHARYTIDLKQTEANGNVFVPAYNNQAWQVGFGFKF